VAAICMKEEWGFTLNGGGGDGTTDEMRQFAYLYFCVAVAFYPIYSTYI
jgi:hypothetical protein